MYNNHLQQIGIEILTCPLVDRHSLKLVSINQRFAELRPICNDEIAATKAEYPIWRPWEDSSS